MTTLDIGPNTGGSQDRSGDSEGGAGAGADLSLVLMVWEVEDVEAGEKTTYLGLWDINCWYQVWTRDAKLLNDDKSSGGMILMIPQDVYKLSDCFIIHINCNMIFQIISISRSRPRCPPQ